MLELAVPLGIALFVWWFSTGIILFLDGLPRRTYRLSMGGATALLCASVYGLIALSNETTSAAAYMSFICGVLIWGWHEMSFLFGWVTGPRKEACPEHCGGWRHFLHAFQAIAYHEFAIAATGVLLLLATWGADNMVGTWTFVILWVMRISAKLNLFLGVPNLFLDFLPDHMSHLRSYLSKKPLNLLFPFSVTLSSVVCALMAQHVLESAPGSFSSVSLILLSSMLFLAIAEHWFLVLPIHTERLWQWAIRIRSLFSPSQHVGQATNATADRRQGLNLVHKRHFAPRNAISPRQ